MRAGACTVQQALTSEAASVLRLSLTLARRRGHAQVTPLHVAATLLSSRASLLKRACLKYHPYPSSHPLQCRALELCFNVALNRLPTIPGPIFHSQPSLSNALIAALKRAQTHQRRGCIEQQQQQQQPLLAIKIELEQLTISILDDPSVSRVMREAGFSSTSVKNNLEDSASSTIFHCSPTPAPGGDIQPTFWQTYFLNSPPDQSPLVVPAQKRHFDVPSAEKNEDLRLIVEVLMRKKRRNTVVVGDGYSCTEGLILELMGKVERGEVPEELRSVQFVKLQLCSVSLKFMKREDVEMKVGELRRKVAAFALEGGAVVYAGDLKWAVEEPGERGALSCYSPVEHLIAELRKLLCDFSSCGNSKVWLVGVSSYQTYMKCQMKNPPLDVQWSLQPVAVPSGGLALSLHASSALDARASFRSSPSNLVESKLLNAMEEQDKLNCCPECTSNFEKEAGIFKSSHQKPSSLPYWMQQPRPENQHKKDILSELRWKWNRLCHSLHSSRYNQVQMNSPLVSQSGNRGYTFSTSHPWWSAGIQYKHNDFTDLNSISFADSASKPGTNSNFMTQLNNQQLFSFELSVSNGAQNHNSPELSLDNLKKNNNRDVKITLALGNPLFSNTMTLKDEMKVTKDSGSLDRALRENLYWQSETISAIAEALHDCKFGAKNGTWFLMQGTDCIGKRRLARVVAESLYGSVNRLVLVNLRNLSDSKATSCMEILIEALKRDADQVVLIEEIDCAETNFIKFLSVAYENGKFRGANGTEAFTSNAVIMLTTGGSSAFDEEDSKKPNSVIRMKFQLEETAANSADLNKRRANWDSLYSVKRLRTGEKDDPLIIDEGEVEKRQFSRQSSSPNLDLNICAEDNEAEGEESNAVQSDLTQEAAEGIRIPVEFLESVANRFIFDQNPAIVGRMMEKLRSRLEGAFSEVTAAARTLDIDEVVLEELVEASDTFVESLFEKWLKEVFQTSVETVENGGKRRGVRVRLTAEGKDGNWESGFGGSSLPKSIQAD